MARLHLHEPVGKAYLDCTPQQQKRDPRSDRISQKCGQDESLSSAVDFFSLLRNLTADGFFTSKIGIKYLGYKGNTYLESFPAVRRFPGYRRAHGMVYEGSKSPMHAALNSAWGDRSNRRPAFRQNPFATPTSNRAALRGR